MSLIVDIRNHNRRAWDKWVEEGINWTIPVADEVIEAARRGDWLIFLSETRPVPHRWFPPLEGLKILCLAGGGGRQGPILAAAGAQVTVLDNSPKMLAHDQVIATRHDLPLKTVEGDMCDLSVFADGAFELIVNPVSNLFVPDVEPVWRECHRVLQPGGVLIAGFLNPMEYIFDQPKLDGEGIFEVRHPLPYSDLDSLTEEERAAAFSADAPLEWSHTFEDQIGGQCAAGFAITGFFEDRRAEGPESTYFPSYFVTRAEKQS